MNLHAQIMNIPAEDHNDLGYKQGHKDARHAAAELVAHGSAELEQVKERLQDMQDMYMEILMCVKRKHDGESRHQTAMRYITEVEKVLAKEVAAAKIERDKDVE